MSAALVVIAKLTRRHTRAHTDRDRDRETPLIWKQDCNEMPMLEQIGSTFKEDRARGGFL